MKARALMNIGQRLGAIAVFFIVLIGCWSIGYYLLPHLLGLAGWTVSNYVQQVLNLLLGILIMYVLVGTVLLVTRRRKKDAGRLLIEAMERIAQGDFSVRLPLRGGDDGPFRDTNPFDDITGSLNKMAVELGELEQMRQDFVSNVSHEIQSPITSIRGFARALRNDRLSKEERLHYLQIIETESVRLSKLSDNLLRLASLEAGRHPFEMKPYRLDRQLSRLILACEPLWTDKKLQMNVQLQECAVEGDEELLSQAWLNLIHNAIKFTPAGGTIDIDLKCDEGQIDFRIADTGIGIEESRHKQIFERFYKVDKARSREAGGSGLGLSLVRQIISLHQGVIRLDSRLGQGSAFTVTLPAKGKTSQ